VTEKGQGLEIRAGYFASEMNARKSLVTTARQGNTTADDYVMSFIWRLPAPKVVSHLSIIEHPKPACLMYHNVLAV